MARKKKSDQITFDDLPAALPTDQPITETIEKKLYAVRYVGNSIARNP